MHQPQDPIQAEQLYRQVVEYDQKGDVYNAVKLCKRLAKLAPDWSAPFAFLGRIYRSRNEWRQTLHYCMKAAEHTPFDDLLWETIGLAATALGDWALAKYAWHQLGLQVGPLDGSGLPDLGIIPVRLNPTDMPEVVAARRIDPVRAEVDSIPQPSSGRRYKDLLLVEKRANGRLFLQQKGLPVFDEIQVLKQSAWQTYCLVLFTETQSDVDILANICRSYGIGFDNWSNAARFLQPNLHKNVAEYFDQSIFGKVAHDSFLVAVAARQPKSIGQALEAWRVVTLKEHSNMECLF